MADTPKKTTAKKPAAKTAAAPKRTQVDAAEAKRQARNARRKKMSHFP